MPHQSRRVLFTLVTAALLAPLTPAVAARAVPAKTPHLQAQQDPAVPARTAAPVPSTAGATGRAATYQAPVWPGGGVAEVDLTGGVSSQSFTGTRKAGTLPVSVSAAQTQVGAAQTQVSAAQTQVGAAQTQVGASQASVGADPRSALPDRVRVEVLDHAAALRSGVDGLLIKVARADGAASAASVRLSVDYTAFRHAYGADWAHRLRLSLPPACADCPAQPLVSTNDTKTGTVSADVPVSAAGGLVALAAEASGSTGDLTASPLGVSATWGVSGSSGAFTWSYPMRTPPGIDGPDPEVGLSYSSSSVDGHMAASNNQPTWVGEGFDMSGGAIERRYLPCVDDMGGTATNKTKTGDMCWRTDNAFLTLDGSGSELVKAADGTWRLRQDDGTRVQLRTGAANGDKDGQHWVVTKPDGTQYWFGRNRMPGWVDGKAVTNSAWTVPVFGNNPGEPCYSSTFSSAGCDRAWRWNLDYVVDPFGNTMTYWYGTESNKYARAGSVTTLGAYTRGGWLARIDYGTRSDTSYGTAPTQVEFGVGDRCLTSSCGTHNATNWPDTPWDQECTGSPCLNGAPTFWTTKRLKTVTTKVRSGSAYRAVDTWTLVHTFPDPGDGTRAGLWLDRIQHAGGTTTMPDVVFGGVQKPNRVDATDLSPAMNWWRVATIRNEMGGTVAVTYSPEDCVRGSRMPSAPESNTLRCYPVRWTPTGAGAPITDYFHRYVVDTVTQSDLGLPSDARAPRTITKYEYLGDPAWHYTDDDGLVKEKDRTWSQWRGYGRVRILTGEGADQERTENVYFRGMHGDKLPSGTRSVTLPAVDGVAAVADEDEYAGLTREEIDYAAPTGSAEIAGTVHTPWRSAPTATRTIGGVTVTARHVGVVETRDRTALDGGRGYRRSTQRTVYDAYGMEAQEEDLGDDAVTGDESCTITTYARNTTAWLLSYPGREQTWALDCARVAAGGLTEDDVVADEYTSYDQQGRGVAPTKGAVSRTEELRAWPGTYLTTSRATHDAHGRIVQAWDVRDNRTTTTFVPATGGPVTGMVSTDHNGWTTTATLDPAWGAVTREVDPNGRRSDRTYDGLGRVTAAWNPGRSKDSGQTANITFAYTVRADGASVTATGTLIPDGSGYVTGYAFVDSLGRDRQTQQPEGGTQGGRLVTDTFYDTAGRAVKANNSYVVDGAPGTTLLLPPADALVASQTRTTYDSAGRITASAQYVKGVKLWQTSTVHGGDRTDTVPPAGGVTRSSFVDIQGHVVRLRESTGASFQETAYQYDRKERLTEVRDAAGNRWTFGYDLRGREVWRSTPDTGRSSKTYSDADDVLTTTDARGRTLASTYDLSGRRTSLREGTATGPLRAEWKYDTLSSGAVVRGRLAKTVRYQGTAQYVSETLGFTDLYQPTGQSVTIPASETGLGGTYTYTSSYTASGLPLTNRLPAVGGQPQETVTTGYDRYGRPVTLSSSLSNTGSDTFIVNGTSFTRYNEVAVVGLRNNDGRWLDIGTTFEEGTRRLKRILSTRETTPSAVLDLGYDHDPAGNILRVSEAVAHDTQCFAYDPLRRLTEAWTPGSGDCAAARSQAGLGGPAPYWQSFTYDAVGNRTTATKRTATGSSSWTHTYPAAGGAQPHTLRGTTVTGSITASAAYTYDAAGNTLTRPVDSVSGSGQALTWDIENELESSTDASGRTEFVYDADGNRLIRRDPTGSTLYLPGQELRYTKADTTKSGTRFYSHAGRTVATRSVRGLNWQVADHQGTVLASATSVDQVVTQRRQTPFGEARGGGTAWPTDKGFVGGTNDNTGLVHLVAREYDPVTGRFVSADAITDLDDPQQANGYSYANNSPVTMSDPDGNMLIGDDYGRIRAIPVYHPTNKRKVRIVYPKRRFIGPVYRPKPKKKPPFIGPRRTPDMHIRLKPKQKPARLGEVGPLACWVSARWCYQRPPTVRDCKANPYGCYQRPPTINDCTWGFLRNDCTTNRVRAPEKPPAPATPRPITNPDYLPNRGRTPAPVVEMPYDQWSVDFCFVVCVGYAEAQKSDGKYQAQFQLGGIGCCGPGLGYSKATVGAEKQGLQNQTCLGVVLGGCTISNEGGEEWSGKAVNIGGKGVGFFDGMSYSWCFYGCDPGEGMTENHYGGWDQFHNPFGD